MMVDTATYLGAWPFRPIEGTTASLARMMRAHGLEQAVVSPLEGFFYTDSEAANERLLRRVRGRKGLWAAPILNLAVANWQMEMERLARSPQVRAVRIAPGFHGFQVAAARGAVEAAAELGLTTVVQIRMQDDRHHRTPVPRIPDAPIDDIVALAAAVPEGRVVVAAARAHDMLEQAEHIRQLPNLWLDISHIDGLRGLRTACDAVGARRLLFATSWPFFYARSALLKVEEADIPRRALEGIRAGNAVRAFALA
jgi:predicted TIM-barrel fold metal-dependent hydrolase